MCVYVCNIIYLEAVQALTQYKKLKNILGQQ